MSEISRLRAMSSLHSGQSHPCLNRPIMPYKLEDVARSTCWSSSLLDAVNQPAMMVAAWRLGLRCSEVAIRSEMM